MTSTPSPIAAKTASRNQYTVLPPHILFQLTNYTPELKALNVRAFSFVLRPIPKMHSDFFALCGYKKRMQGLDL
ncbi:hypothetical protein [Janthinobacterium sp. RB2R34]|uniref:hypothetical protein n=1 Tax=Janthinobacterium sp. RB2R34 TaxID=3424193 RepID=UPI003F200BCF